MKRRCINDNNISHYQSVYQKEKGLLKYSWLKTWPKSVSAMWSSSSLQFFTIETFFWVLVSLFCISLTDISSIYCSWLVISDTAGLYSPSDSPSLYLSIKGRLSSGTLSSFFPLSTYNEYLSPFLTDLN